MNILISHTSLFKKGGWGRIFPLAEGLTQNGNKVTILTTNKCFSIATRSVIISNVRVIIYPEIIPPRISRMGFGLLSLFLKIVHVCLNKYDIVHSDNGHRPLSGIPCRIHKKLHGSVYVAEWYDWYGKGGQYDNKNKFFKLLLGPYELNREVYDKKAADGVVVVSEVLRKRAQSFKSPESIVKIQGGAYVNAIPFLQDNSNLKERYNIGRDTITLGYINSDSYRLAEFLPVLNTIDAYNLQKEVKILVFGKYDLIKKQIPERLAGNIIFFGWIDYTNEYEKLQLVDIFFLFKEEMLGNKAGWPNCVGDYLACGRHILLNPVGEMIGFAEKYSFAFIPTKREEKEIYIHIRQIQENKLSMINQRINIRKLAEDIVSWEVKSSELESFYKFLLKKKHS